MTTNTPSPGWALRLHGAFDWVLWALTINALWYLFTVLGGVVLGIAPASATAAELTRRRLRGEAFPVLPAFWAGWRGGLRDANIALLPGFAVTGMLLIGLVGMVQAGSLGTPFGLLALVALGLTASVTAIAVPLYAHYDLRRAAYLPTALRWSLRNLPHVAVHALVAVAVVGAGFVVPGIIPFLSVGAWISASTAMCLAFFAANDRRIAEQAAAR